VKLSKKDAGDNLCGDPLGTFTERALQAGGNTVDAAAGRVRDKHGKRHGKNRFSEPQEAVGIPVVFIVAGAVDSPCSDCRGRFRVSRSTSGGLPLWPLSISLKRGLL
jgi:hypothetical protein